MRRILLVLGVIGMALGAGACGGSGTEEDARATITEAVASITESVGSVAEDLTDGVEVSLQEQNGSGESGTATLTVNDDGSLHVALQLSGAPAEAQPAHIHRGTCAELDPEPAFPLTNVVNGSSETEVQVSLEDLAAESYAVNVHRSEAEAETYVACGDITNLSP
jgi:CHRD domain-containing protein